MDGLVVQRWKRYGHDRTYVNTDGGTRLGYRDNITGAVVTDDEAFRPVVEKALRGPEDVAPVTPVWTDLADHRAGASARAQARELRAAAPVRTLLARMVGAKTEERAWRIGADGERAVAAQLARLGPDWRVLHAVPVGRNGSDIDHVVIGPGGVYTVNTKHHPDAAVWVGGDTVMVDGQRQPYVRNSRHEAQRAARLLASAGCGSAPRVTGIVAVLSPRATFTERSQPADGSVVVIARRRLVGWLGLQPAVLDEDAVDRIYTVARRSTTWVG